MTRNDIAAEICKRIPDLSKSTALHVVDSLVSIFTDAFSAGENVYLRGFGSLEIKITKEKKARNITTGATVIVPAGRTVKFKISKLLKEQLNTKSDF